MTPSKTSYSPPNALFEFNQEILQTFKTLPCISSEISMKLYFSGATVFQNIFAQQ